MYDAVVRELTAAGLAVILNNHTNTTRWCCGVDGNERWNASQSTAAWENDWLFMARRYRDNKRVVGADLYNEVRRNIWDDPNWGLGDDHDWFAASQRVGDRILTEANPDLLIIVEGINWTGIPVDGLPHERPTLEPVRRLSHTLVDSGKLVYSAHFYDYTGPNHSGATGTGETTDPRYRDLTPAELIDVLNRQAFFVTARTGPALHRPRLDQRVRRRRPGRDGRQAARLVRELRRPTDPHRRRLRVLAARRLAREPQGQRLGPAALGRRRATAWACTTATTGGPPRGPGSSGPRAAPARSPP